MYEGIATLADGTTVTVTGTFPELADWADNFIRSRGECNISITMKRERENENGKGENE